MDEPNGSGTVPAPAIVHGPQWVVPFVAARDQVLAAAREHADRIALEDAEGAVSYSQLESESAAFAQSILRAQPDRPGDRRFVAVLGQRSARCVAALLGVWRTGAAYFPIDSSYPIDRIQLLLDDADPGAVIVDETSAPTEVVAELINRPGTVLMSDVASDTGSLGSRRIDVGIDPPIAADDLAYIIYTSGSTGKPKGACISHRNLANLISARSHEVGLTFLDRQGWTVKVSFDATVGELWPALSVGATVCAAPAEVETGLRTMVDWLRTERITSLLMGTALVNMLLGSHNDWWSGLSLRALITGGDRLTRRPPPNLPFRLINAYGPTECTVIATFGSTAPVARYSGGAQSPSIGTPIANTFVVIVDDQRRLCNIGEPGELCIGGACVGQGYLARPELTAERFIDDVYTSVSGGGKLYRTGDQALVQQDGNIRFLGRNDRQIALHGFRVEAGEVEAAIQEDPDVAEVLVKRHDFPGLGPRMIAFLTFTGEAGGDALGRLKQQVASRLPAYMMPNQFVVMDDMPYTPHGKIDENALVPPERARDLATEAFVPPEGATESALCMIFAEVLSMSRMGATDDFFSWGGDSISAIELIAAIEEKFGMDLDSGTLQEHPTPRSVAALVSGRKADPGDSAVDWELEMVPRKLRHRARPQAKGRPAVLVTGASGFIGSAIVQGLIETKPELRVVGLCRSERAASAMRSRVVCDDPAQIEPVDGDLTRPGLGLDPQVWTALSDRLVGIVHAGAEVNHVKSYAALKSANVDATSELLQLAAEAGSCPFVYVSSISTIGADTGPVPEFPYSQSKWVSEHHVGAAASEIPVSICRVARALPDTRGRWLNTSDTITILLQASVLCGGIPDFAHSEPATPVDVIAASLISMHDRPLSANGGDAVGYAPMEVLHWADLAARVRDVHAIPSMSWIDWISALKSDGGEMGRLALSLVQIAPEGMYMTDERVAIEADIGAMQPVIGNEDCNISDGYIAMVADIVCESVARATS